MNFPTEEEYAEWMAELDKLGPDYLGALRELGGREPEIEHIVADKLLCSLLIRLGRVDEAKAFYAIEKWYG